MQLLTELMKQGEKWVKELPSTTRLEQLGDAVLAKVGLNQSEVQDTLKTVSEVWSAQTLQGLIDGQVVIPEKIVKEQLLDQAQSTDQFEILDFECLDNGEIRLEVRTPQMTQAILNVAVHSLEHNEIRSQAVLEVTKREVFSDNRVKAFILGRLSIGILTALFGRFQNPQDLNITANGNQINIDFREMLYQSKVGEFKIFGLKLVNVIDLRGITIQKNQILLRTNLNLPKYLQQLILRLYKVKA